jgi:hypothetical protein
MHLILFFMSFPVIVTATIFANVLSAFGIAEPQNGILSAKIGNPLGSYASDKFIAVRRTLGRSLIQFTVLLQKKMSS